jgi:hypothetical protein
MRKNDFFYQKYFFKKKIIMIIKESFNEKKKLSLNHFYAPIYKNKNYTFKPFRWWPSGKSLGLRGLLPLWSQVRALWLLI